MTKYIERPDDNELLTPEWVYANFGSMGQQYSARQRMDAKAVVWENRFERFTLFGHPVPQIKTRGQIRMLIFTLTSINDLTRQPNLCPQCEKRLDSDS